MNDMPGISPRLAMQFSIDLIQYDFPGGTIKIVAISSFLLKLINFNHGDQCRLTEYFKTKKYKYFKNIKFFFFCINFIRSLRLPQEHSAHLGGSRTLTNYNKTHNTQQTENK
jgi:hypothetical protein